MPWAAGRAEWSRGGGRRRPTRARGSRRDVTSPLGIASGGCGDAAGYRTAGRPAWGGTGARRAWTSLPQRRARSMRRGATAAARQARRRINEADNGRKSGRTDSAPHPPSCRGDERDSRASAGQPTSRPCRARPGRPGPADGSPTGAAAARTAMEMRRDAVAEERGAAGGVAARRVIGVPPRSPRRGFRPHHSTGRRLARPSRA